MPGRPIFSSFLPDDQLQFLTISIERSSDEVFWRDFSGNIIYVNEAACRITSYTREETCSLRIESLDPELSPGTGELSRVPEPA